MRLATAQPALTTQVITSHIQIILIITGILTATTLVQFVAPSWVLRHAYGEIPTGAGNIALARHWGLLLFCVGMLLVYSAFYPPLRESAVVLASIEKAGFVALVATSLYRRPIALFMAVGDAVIVLVFVFYLAGF
jgi:hypothetical protein